MIPDMATHKPAEFEVDERAAEEYIVDTDFHAGPSSDMADLLPYIDDDVVEEKLRVSGTIPSPAGVQSNYANNIDSGYHKHGKAEDTEDVQEVMEQFCIDELVIGPGMNKLVTVQYPRIKTAVCSALNDYLLDQVVSPDDGVYTHVALPVWDPAACAAELDRVGDETGVAGAYGWYGPYTPLLGESEYDPMYDRLSELDLPFAIHVGGGTYPPIGITEQSVRTRTESLGLMNTYYAMQDVANMITTGVFEKYPDLRVVVQEAGVSWIPFLANRMNEIYYTQPEDIKLTERMAELGKEYLEHDPGDYVYENFHFSTQPIALPKRNKGAMLRLCEAERTFMYSSDWPHHTLDPVNWVFDPAIDDDLRDQILHGTAERCYGLNQ
jgi:predicted TIM-barrel fold metal-dependent hydrolase